jgi:hypothetical protein
MESMDTIGTDSTLSVDDAKWLNSLIERLRDHGEHAKALYLDKLINNAHIKAARDCADQKLFDYETLQRLARDKTKDDLSKWTMYANDVVGHIVHRINTTMVEQLKVNAKQTSFRFKYDYQRIADEFNHFPPYCMENGLCVIAEKLMYRINTCEDWVMQVKKCNKKALSFEVLLCSEHLNP